MFELKTLVRTSDPREAVLQFVRLVEAKLPTQSLKRSDLRFRKLLSRLPPEHGTLGGAIEVFRARCDAPNEPLRTILANLYHEVMAIARYPIEQALIEGVRPALASDRDAACLELLMGWVDGHLKTPEEVGAEFDTSPERVREIELHAHAEIAQRGLWCPQLHEVLEWVRRRTPMDDKGLGTVLKERARTRIWWSIQALIATADLLSIETGLTLMEIGDRDYLTSISDETYPRRVTEYAFDRLVLNGRARISEIAAHVSAQIGQALKPRDVRIVLAPFGVRWLDSEHETFTFKAR